MEVDPAVGLDLHRGSEFRSKLTYAEVVDGLRVTDPLTTPLDMLAGIKVEALSPCTLPGRSEAVALAPLFIPPDPRPIKLVWASRPLSPAPALQPLTGNLPSKMEPAWSKVKARYGTRFSTGEQGLFSTTGASVASGAPAPNEAFSDLEIPEGNQGQACSSA